VDDYDIFLNHSTIFQRFKSLWLINWRQLQKRNI